MAAAYECTVSCTDDETFILTLELMNADGSAFDVSAYAFDYSLKGCGSDLALDQSDGIAVDIPSATLTISPGVDVRLKRGTFNHGLRKRHLVSGQVDQIFDGTVTVTEGNF